MPYPEDYIAPGCPDPTCEQTTVPVLGPGNGEVAGWMCPMHGDVTKLVNARLKNGKSVRIEVCVVPNDELSALRREVRGIARTLIAATASIIEELQGVQMTLSTDLHDLVTQFGDALTAIETEIDTLSAKVDASETNTVDPADVQGLRDALAKAKTLSTQAVATSTTAQGDTPDTSASQSPVTDQTTPAPETNVQAPEPAPGDVGTVNEATPTDAVTEPTNEDIAAGEAFAAKVSEFALAAPGETYADFVVRWNAAYPDTTVVPEDVWTKIVTGA